MDVLTFFSGAYLIERAIGKENAIMVVRLVDYYTKKLNSFRNGVNVLKKSFLSIVPSQRGVLNLPGVLQHLLKIQAGSRSRFGPFSSNRS